MGVSHFHVHYALYLVDAALPQQVPKDCLFFFGFFSFFFFVYGAIR